MDEQLVSTGQRVRAGDTIGMVGNNGNAATTSPYLHFRIYAAGGAIDPLPFVNQNVRKPTEVNVSRIHLQDTLRSTAAVKTENKAYTANVIFFPLAVSAKAYRVKLPDVTLADVSTSALQPVEAPLRQGRTKRDSFLLESP